MNNVRISVVIPAFNAEKTISRALLSVLNQEVLPEELIVIDDGSTDQTAYIAKQYESEFKIPITVISTSNQGVATARNLGIFTSTFEYIALLDADDEYCQGHIRRMKEAIEIYPEAALFFAASKRHFDNDSKICTIEKESLPDFTEIALKYWPENVKNNFAKLNESLLEGLLKGSFIPLCTVVFPKIINNEKIEFTVSLSYGEDHDFLIRLISKGSTIFINETGGIIHRDGENASSLGNSLVNSRRRLESFVEIRKIDCIKHSAKYSKVVECHINTSVRNFIYYSSFEGFNFLLNSLKLVFQYDNILLRKNIVMIGKNVIRSLYFSLMNHMKMR